MKIRITAFILSIIFTFPGCFNKKKEGLLDNDLVLFGILGYALNEANCNGSNRFWVRNLVTNKSECIKTTLKTSGTSINIYVDTRIAPNLDYDYLKNEFDTKIMPNSDIAFGAASDLNQNGKIDIVITDIKDGATPGTGYVAGFFDPIDFFPDDPSYPVRSNYREVLNIDGKELAAALAKEPTEMVSTIAHELQHLVRFPHILNQYYTDPSFYDDPIWINEGTSEVASEINYGTQTSRLKCFNGSSSYCPNGVNGVSLENWQSDLEHYAYAYAFMSHLYQAAGTNRATFLKDSVVGMATNGTRASSTEAMVYIFKNFAGSSYNGIDFLEVMSDANMTVYQSLLISFLGQTLQIPDTTETMYIGSKALYVTYNNMKARYPMAPSLLAGVTTDLDGTTPKLLPTTTPPLSIYPGEADHVTGTKTGSSNTAMVMLQDASTSYVVANGDTTSTFNYGNNFSIMQPVQLPTLQLAKSGKTCALNHMNKLHKLERVLLKLDQRRTSF